jgi:hypothetical protein
MNEIDSSEALNDLEVLKRTQPQWKVSRLEPFLQSAQQNTVAPDWKKLQLPVSISKDGEALQDSGAFVTYNVIINGQRALADFDSRNIRFI